MNVCNVFKNFYLLFNSPIYKNFSTQLQHYYLEITGKYLLSLGKNISPTTTVAAIIYKYHQLSDADKSLVNEFLNKNKQEFHYKFKDHLVCAIIEYDPKLKIDGQKTCLDVLMEQTHCFEDIKFLNIVTGRTNDKRLLLYKRNPYFILQCSQRIFIGAETVHIGNNHQNCHVEELQLPQSLAIAALQIDDVAENIFSIPIQQNCAPVQLEMFLCLSDLADYEKVDTNRLLLRNSTINLCISVYSKTSMYNAAVRRNNLMHKTWGHLNWFLLHLHGAEMRFRLQQRTMRVTALLKKLQLSNLAIDGIVSFLLLHENRYAAALLYNYAPTEFRSILLRYKIPIHIPLLVPMDQFGNFRSRYIHINNYSKNQIPLEIRYYLRHCEDEKIPTEIERLFLGFNLISMRRKADDCFILQCNSTVACLLLCATAKISKIKIYSDEWLIVDTPAQTVAASTDYYWYSVSMKQYTDNIRALTYATESSYEVDPPLNCAKMADLRVYVEWCDESTAKNNSITVYCRALQVLRKDGDVIGQLFTQLGN